MGMSYATARDEQAAYWYLKLQEADVTPEEIQAALAWQSDPENRAAFERVETYWRAWPAGSSTRARIWPTRRLLGARLWSAAAAFLAIVSVGLWVGLTWRGPDAAPPHEYSTSVGQLRTLWLEDGTEVILGGATSIRADFSARARRIVMSEGEALFLVAKDRSRPFIVDVPNGSARALGTTFNVHRGIGESTITVLEGLVEVSPPSWRPGSSINLQAAKQVALSPDGAVGEVGDVDPREVASWSSGRLIFIDRTLKSVLADLNRYSSKPVTLAASNAADLRVSGNVKLGQIDGWLRALGPAFGLEVVETEHGLMLVSESQKAPID